MMGKLELNTTMTEMKTQIGDAGLKKQIIYLTIILITIMGYQKSLNFMKPGI